MGVVFGDVPQEETSESTSKASTSSVRAHTGEAIDVTKTDDSNIDSGTIVTNKKHGDSVLGSIKDAATEWGTDRAATVKKTLEPFKRPEAPKVTPGRERKEVIQESVENAKQAALDDHQVVIERIKTLQQDAERITGKPFSIKAKEPEEKARWTHILGEKEMAPAAPAPERVQSVRREQITSGTGASIAGSVDKRIEAKPDDYLPKSETSATRESLGGTTGGQIAPDTNVRTAMPEAPKQETVKENLAAHKGTIAPRIEKPIPTAPPAPATPPVSPPPTPPRPAPTTRPKKRSRVSVRVVLVALLVVVLMGGIGAGGYYVWQTRLEGTLGATPVVVTENKNTLALSTDKDEFFLNFENALQDGRGNLFRITLTDAYGVSPASAASLFSVVASDTADTFTRTLKGTPVVGGVGDGDAAPFIVVSVDSFDVALAGLLEWETVMSRDLAPLFGNRVSASESENGELFAPRFVDTEYDGVHARVLRDQNGADRIVYTLRDDNTLILTTTRNALGTLLRAF